MESMLYSRHIPACTIFKSVLHDERPIIIVAGGFGSGENIAEVLDFTQEGTSWKESNLIFASIIFFVFFKDGSLSASDNSTAQTDIILLFFAKSHQLLHNIKFW